MPELPEVETIVRGLNKKVRGKKIAKIWTDWPRHFACHKGGFASFKRQVMGSTIKNVTRIGKNIIFELSSGSRMLIHLKMTGRLLFLPRKSDARNIGSRVFGHRTSQYWASTDPYIHTIFYFSDGTSLAFSDVRKFGKIVLLEGWSGERFSLDSLPNIGPDALKITLPDLVSRLKRRKTVIKKVLLDQKVLAGIGNIYADEILFTAGIHPLKKANQLASGDLSNIHRAVNNVLAKAVKLRGTSMSDYRDVMGKLGNYYSVRLVYGREGEPCPGCSTAVLRIVAGGRSSHFCPRCQR